MAIEIKSVKGYYFLDVWAMTNIILDRSNRAMTGNTTLAAHNVMTKILTNEK